jgi:hypothetical protein
MKTNRRFFMASEAEERWKRLAALGVQHESPTPEGEARMSAVVLQLAEPLLKQHGKTPQRAEAIIMLTIAAWNKSMFPPDKQLLVEKDLIDSFVPKDGNAEDVAVGVVDMMVKRRERLFPDLRKIIVNYKCIISGGRLTLEVSSAPIPELG